MFGLFKKKHTIGENQILLDCDLTTMKVMVVRSLMSEKDTRKLLCDAFKAFGGKTVSKRHKRK